MEKQHERENNNKVVCYCSFFAMKPIAYCISTWPFSPALFYSCDTKPEIFGSKIDILLRIIHLLGLLKGIKTQIKVIKLFLERVITVVDVV